MTFSNAKMEAIAMVLRIRTTGHAATAMAAVQGVLQIFRQCALSLFVLLEDLITVVMQAMYALNLTQVYGCVRTLAICDCVNKLQILSYYLFT